MQMTRGMDIRVRRWGFDGTLLQDKSTSAAAAVDILCVNSQGGALSGDATAGCTVVKIDFNNYVEGGLPRVAKCNGTNGYPVAGVVCHNQGSVADGAKCWVRVLGRHDYALVDGTTDVAKGHMLTPHTTSGVLAKTTTQHYRKAYALAAQAANSAEPCAVYLMDSENIYKP